MSSTPSRPSRICRSCTVVCTIIGPIYARILMLDRTVAASTTFLVYDLLTTLDDEVRKRVAPSRPSIFTNIQCFFAFRWSLSGSKSSGCVVFQLLCAYDCFEALRTPSPNISTSYRGTWE